jgi:hypothetical protein
VIPGRPRCSGESLARDEELFATASLVTSWILFEQQGAWGPDALIESGFPESARPLAEAAGRLGVRTLLIRRRTAENRLPVVFLASSGNGRRPPWMVSGSFTDSAELGDLDIEGLAEGRMPDFGQPVPGPVYLVCTHGRHDICCADKGRPLYRAMSELWPDRTWEVSHIGGDRFAGNVLVLPRGDYFGRLEPEDASNLVAEYEAGRLDLAHHRGRSIQPRLVQAAEAFLREARSLTRIDDLELIDYKRIDHDHAEVVFRDLDDAAHKVRVAARSIHPRAYLTCRAEEPGQPTDYVLQSITTE